MRFGQSSKIGDTQFVRLKDDEWLRRQQRAGKTVAKCLKYCKHKIETSPGISLKELEQNCVNRMYEEGSDPTFLNYKGFPGGICTSVNKQLVHGIPTDYKIKEGDVVSVDMGATYEGAIADAAITAICGKAKDWQHERLLKYCQGALHKAIDAVKVGDRIGCIGRAIHHHVKSSGFRLITSYGGHGIDYNKPHAQPFVANKASKEDGVVIQPGMVLAIEPMLVMGLSSKTKTMNDGWTVVAGGIGAHFEHSLFVGKDKIHVVTEWEADRLQG
jgi:methionyl aminopeptidase